MTTPLQFTSGTGAEASISCAPSVASAGRALTTRDGTVGMGIEDEARLVVDPRRAKTADLFEEFNTSREGSCPSVFAVRLHVERSMKE